MQSIIDTTNSIEQYKHKLKDLEKKRAEEIKTCALSLLTEIGDALVYPIYIDNTIKVRRSLLTKTSATLIHLARTKEVALKIKSLIEAKCDEMSFDEYYLCNAYGLPEHIGEVYVSIRVGDPIKINEDMKAVVIVTLLLEDITPLNISECDHCIFLKSDDSDE